MKEQVENITSIFSFPPPDPVGKRKRKANCLGFSRKACVMTPPSPLAASSAASSPAHQWVTHDPFTSAAIHFNCQQLLPPLGHDPITSVATSVFSNHAVMRYNNKTLPTQLHFIRHPSSCQQTRPSTTAQEIYNHPVTTAATSAAIPVISGLSLSRACYFWELSFCSTDWVSLLGSLVVIVGYI